MANLSAVNTKNRLNKIRT